MKKYLETLEPLDDCLVEILTYQHLILLLMINK